jgi:DNA primase catalytic subunit
MATESHDKMIAAFQEYFKHNDKFEWDATEASGIKARYWLSEIRRHASIRRKEIMSKRDIMKKARNGRNGRPPKAT